MIPDCCQPARRLFVWIGTCVWILATQLPVVARSESPTMILHHGRIVTVDSQFRIESAIAIRGERIVATGEDADILRLSGPDTVSVDLEGKMVLPGLIDSHVHASAAAVYEFDHPIPSMESIDDVLAYVRSRTEATPEGQWINISQVFVTRLREPRFPSRQELDSVAPKHPVCFRTGPDAALNSLALELNGIDRSFKPGPDVTAKIERDSATGEPTGIIRNYGKLLKLGSSSRSPTEGQRLEAVAELLHDYNSVGITSAAERTASNETVALYTKLRDTNQLTCRMFLNWSLDPNAPLEEIEKKVQEAVDHPAHQYDPWVWLRGVKIFLDGGMLTGSAYMRQPWGVSKIYSIDDPSYRGMLYVEPERLYQVAKLCLRNDLQFTAHSVGDGAVHALLDAYGMVNEEFPVRDARPCITHCNFMSQEAIDRMRELGVVADLQPVWLWLDGRTLRKQFGEERLAFFQPYRSLERAGVMVGGGSDHMQKIGSLRAVNPYNPFLGIWTALTRLPRGEQQPLHPEQIITREQAIRLYTSQNAYILLDEKNRGSLEPGKLADFIVLDRDILACPLEELRDTRVLRTYVGGRLVYTQP